MAVFSKFLDRVITTHENTNLAKIAFSQVVVGLAICAYAVKLTNPLFVNTSKSEAPTSNELINNITDEEFKLAEAEKLIIEKELKKSKRKHNTEPSLNKEFTQQLAKLIRIMVPRLFCYETGLLTVHTICLISRTFLSIFVAALEGEIVKFIVRKDIKQFAIVLVKWFGIAIPATFVNSMIRFLESKLALSFRTRLVKHSYQLYFKNQNYYRVSNLDGRVENADHRLTEDISVFSSSIAHLYSSLTKPCFDLMLIGLTLMRSSQKMKANILSGPALAVCVISLTAYIMRIVSPKFGQLVSEEANRYAYLRHIHSRIITNAEEIAFYGGHKVELQQLRQAYNRLAIQMNNIFIQKLWFIMLEQFFMKYVWSGTGMVMVSLPILTSSFQRNVNNEELKGVDRSVMDPNISERTQYLTTARNLLISAADAIERLMSSYKEIVALAGYTHRVAGMIEVLQDTAQGVYKRTTVDEKMNTNNIIEFRNGTPIAKGKIIYFDEQNEACISLHSVPVVTPNCDIVIPNLTLCIKPGMHLLITGPNGCGKSSLFRILSGMWPIYSGELHIPRPVEGKPCMFYIPQRPYMSIGSLCDQIIYPDNRDDMKNKGITIDELKRILKMVNLEHIAQRDSFDGIRDWKDILSGGEKQRMAIARLFYHKPKYALLDECTSAVSIDVESSIYEEAKSMGITLLTITHRPTLWKYHTHILEFDGQGSWNFRKMEPNEQQRRKAK